MAKENTNKIEKELAKISTNSSLLAFGTDTVLDQEEKELRNVIRQTMNATKEKFGERTSGKPINYFNEVNIGNIFSGILADNKGSNKKDEKLPSDDLSFKAFMNNNKEVDPMSIIVGDQGRLMSINNYRIIFNHITECSQALNVIKDNIMSPDDFTKLIFHVSYDEKLGEEKKQEVKTALDNLTTRYEIEDLADHIIEETLKVGEHFVAVLSIDDELNLMLGDPMFKKNAMPNGILNEDMVRKFAQDSNPAPILSESVGANEEIAEILSDLLEADDVLSVDKTNEIIAKMINENIIIGSKAEMITERYNAETQRGVDIPGTGKMFGNKTSQEKGKKKRDDKKPLYINGSSVRELVPERVLELTIDNFCYGYYYVEETGNTIANSMYLGAASGRTTTANTSIASNGTIAGTTATDFASADSAAKRLGVSEQKLKLITDIFINKIADKVDKDFICKNKNIKEFIYELVKQDFIIKRGVKMTFFRPDEVIKFKVPALYKNITFLAKLYLSVLTNDILIKLGRAHDKRLFYVSTGLDANYEQAISKVIQDIKTKDYKLDNLNDFNTILQLNPGRFDDYFMPQIGGERPIDIETLPGMDTDMNTEFVEFLRNSMLSGIGVPRSLIDAMGEVDFARTVSTQNANFVRSVIKYQKLLTAPFNKLYRRLFMNEYRYNGEEENKLSDIVNVEKINISFPSPAALVMDNLSSRIQIVDQNADFIATQFIIPDQQGLNEQKRLKLKTEIVKDMLPEIDWDKYEELYKSINIKDKKNELENPPADPNADPYGGMGY